MTLQSKMTDLADACRSRFSKTGKLSIDDMINLIKSGFTPGETLLSNYTLASSTGWKKGQTLTVPLDNPLPSNSSKALKLSIDLNFPDWNAVQVGFYTMQNGTKKLTTYTLPANWQDFQTQYAVAVTIPAGTVFADDNIQFIYPTNASRDLVASKGNYIVKSIVATYA